MDDPSKVTEDGPASDDAGYREERIFYYEGEYLY